MDVEETPNREPVDGLIASGLHFPSTFNQTAASEIDNVRVHIHKETMPNTLVS